MYSGECEVDLGSTTEPGKFLLGSLWVTSADQLTEALEEAASFCRDDSS